MKIRVTETTAYADGVATSSTHDFSSWDRAFAFIAGEARSDLRAFKRHRRVFWESKKFDVAEVPS